MIRRIPMPTTAQLEAAAAYIMTRYGHDYVRWLVKTIESRPDLMACPAVAEFRLCLYDELADAGVMLPSAFDQYYDLYDAADWHEDQSRGAEGTV
jgi:hypothetical protein